MPPVNPKNAKKVKKAKRKKKHAPMPKWAKLLLSATAFGAVGGVVACAVFFAGAGIIGKVKGGSNSNTQALSPTVVYSSDGNKESGDTAEIAANVMPSVVSITNLSVQEVQDFFFGHNSVQEYESSGSGIIVGQNDTELLIVTNNHVVEDNKSLTVTFTDESTAEAYVKGTDADRDIAVIAVQSDKIGSETMQKIKIATLGDSNKLAVGDRAIAIGNALGYGQSVTQGIISAVGRTISGYDSALIQTDAAINKGNSGGALVNGSGEVIGINSIKLSGDTVESMGYAIPISDVKSLIDEFMNRQARPKIDEANRGSLGISCVDVDDSGSSVYDMPEGVYIREILKGGAAEKAGIPKGAIIVEFDGNSVKSTNGLTGLLEYYKKGEKVNVVVMVKNSKGEYAKKTYEVTLSGRSVLNNAAE